MIENHMVIGGDYHIDDRPIICYCEKCRDDIRGGDGAYGGDRYYDFSAYGRGEVHKGCFVDWLQEFEKEGADEPTYCVKCGEDVQDWLHYNMFGEVYCSTCVDDWAEDYLREE